MNKIVSLIKKEWYIYKFSVIAIIMIGFLFIWILPIFLEQFINSIQSEEMRVVSLFFTFISLLIIPIIQLLTSLHRDIKEKDIWLHNQNSIFSLIGAKWLFALLSLIFYSLIFFLGFFFLGEFIIASWWQIILFILVLIYVQIAFYVVFSMFSLLFFAAYINIKRFIGRLSLLIVFAFIAFFLWIIGKIPENFMEIPYGKIPTDWINQNLPKFKSASFEIHDIDLYFADIAANLLLIVIFYIGACKWIEKVITR